MIFINGNIATLDVLAEKCSLPISQYISKYNNNNNNFLHSSLPFASINSMTPHSPHGKYSEQQQQLNHITLNKYDLFC